VVGADGVAVFGRVVADGGEGFGVRDVDPLDTGEQGVADHDVVDQLVPALVSTMGSAGTVERWWSAADAGQVAGRPVRSHGAFRASGDADAGRLPG